MGRARNSSCAVAGDRFASVLGGRRGSDRLDITASVPTEMAQRYQEELSRHAMNGNREPALAELGLVSDLRRPESPLVQNLVKSVFMSLDIAARVSPQRRRTFVAALGWAGLNTQAAPSPADVAARLGPLLEERRSDAELLLAAADLHRERFSRGLGVSATKMVQSVSRGLLDEVDIADIARGPEAPQDAHPADVASWAGEQLGPDDWTAIARAGLQAETTDPRAAAVAEFKRVLYARTRAGSPSG